MWRNRLTVIQRTRSEFKNPLKKRRWPRTTFVRMTFQNYHETMETQTSGANVSALCWSFITWSPVDRQRVAHSNCNGLLAAFCFDKWCRVIRAGAWLYSFARSERTQAGTIWCKKNAHLCGRPTDNQGRTQAWAHRGPCPLRNYLINLTYWHFVSE